jgi:hypothetical protein
LINADICTRAFIKITAANPPATIGFILFNKPAKIPPIYKPGTFTEKINSLSPGHLLILL